MDGAASISEEANFLHANKTLINRAVQTDDDTEELIQISSSLQELMHRISSYQRYKRFQLDIGNQVEFCHCNQFDTTCARTDAAHFRRSSKLRNYPDKIQGEKGPLGKPLLPLEQFQRSLQEQTSIWEHRGALSPTFSLLHMPQRISNMEQCLHDNQGGNRPKDLLSRVAQLEIRLLAVEGRSWEYNHVKVSTYRVTKKQD